MTKNELLSIIRNELINNPQATNMGIAKKYKIPFKIVKLIKRSISNEQKD
ncbi:hypothetical protein QUF94_27740 [Peribacillus sp. NJ4]|nr:hypothetical protein [Peribacillus sp. NJ4]MDM5215109.1 hypothetical protein [Peribacillus sp. NJ4]